MRKFLYASPDPEGDVLQDNDLLLRLNVKGTVKEDELKRTNLL